MKSFRIAHALVAATLMCANAQTSAPAPAKPKPAKPVAVKPVTARPAPAETAVSTNDPVVITYGDQKITKSQFEALVATLPDELRAQANGPNKRKFAEQLVEMKSLAYEARHRKLDETPEAKQRIAIQIDNALASELFRSLNTAVKVDDAAISAYYDQHKNEYEQAKASHILIRFKGSQVPARSGQPDLTVEEALAKAKDLRAKILAGADFATLAKAESDDVGSGPNGGSLGEFGRGRMVPVFEQAVFTQPVGELGEPVKSEFGYHIIKVEARSAKSLDEVKPQILARLKPEMARKALDEVKKTIPTSIDETYFGK